MRIIFLTIIALVLIITNTKAQTAMQFSGPDCNNNQVNLYNDLDAGKAVVLFFYMPSCGSCPPVAKKIQTMANNVNTTYPGMVKAYAFPYQNSTTCSYSASWTSSNNLPLYAPMDSGAVHVAHYGGFGMPTVVLLGGSDHRVMFSTLSFVTSDTTIMRDSILNLLNTTNIQELPQEVNSFDVFPNPAAGQVSINVDLNTNSTMLLDIINIMGQVVATIGEEKQSGLVSKQFDTTTLPNGLYFVRLQTAGQTAVKPLQINN